MDLEILEYITSPSAVVSGIVFIIVAVLLVIAEWKILKKAGEKGWKTLIPFYNVFISHHIVGMAHIWFIIEVIVWIIEAAFVIVEAVPHTVDIVFGVATGIFTLASGLVHAIRLCNCFGKGTGFKIGTFLLPNVFTLILGFGKAEYKKP